MSRHPEVLWAQRSSSSDLTKNIIYLTVNVPDIVESSLQYGLTAKTLSFKATAGVERADYAFDLDLYAEVLPELSTQRLTSRSLFVVLRKKEAKTEYWPRLTQEKTKTPFIKTDFSKWVDEDEQDGNPNIVDDEFGGGPGGIPGMEDFDFSKMGSSGFGANPASTLANEDDSDEEEDGPPALEDPAPAK